MSLIHAMQDSSTCVSCGKETIPEETEIFADLGRLFTSADDLGDLLNRVLALIAGYCPFERGFISIYHEESGRIHIDAHHGYTGEEAQKGVYRPGEGVMGTVISSGKPMVVPSILKEPLFLNKTGSHSSMGGEDFSFICVPISINAQVIGTISVHMRARTDFARELNILTVVAIMIGHAVRERIKIIEREERLKQENRLLRIRLKKKYGSKRIVGNSPSMQDLYEKILMVAPTPSTVLITGETGTGKEMIANALQANSERRDRPFVRVNIAALPANLIESELFGHERGAFTGAMSSKKGRFELANTGTIFLDEIGDLDLSLQVRLLRVMQERCIEPLGGTRSVSLDVRIIAATHRDLDKMIEAGEFRQDLYYRLNVFPLHAPPLRERKVDILLLADYFLEKYNREMNKEIRRLSSEAIDMLSLYHWPGNVRELENCIQRAVILSNENVIRSYHLPPTLQVAEDTSMTQDTLENMTNRYVREVIIDHLKMTHGNITRAAEILGTTKRILNYRIKNLGIDYSRYRKG